MSIFAPIYQGVEDLFGWYNSDYGLIFDYLYDNGGYDKFGWTMVLVPMVIVALFYFVLKYPYAKKWHWGLMILISSVVVFGLTMNFANIELLSPQNDELMEALSNQESGYQDFAETLPFKYSMLNSVLSIIVGFLASLAAKPFSKCQMHLPF